MMITQIALLALGFVMLIKGADWFVDGCADLASAIGISQMVIGLTVVAMGTSMPEAAVSITAAAKGTADIAVGNIIGSNILNILIILGLASLLIPVRVDEEMQKQDIPFMGFITIVLIVMGYTGSTVTRLEGVGLCALFGFYLWRLFRVAKKEKETVRTMESGDVKGEKPAKVDDGNIETEMISDEIVSKKAAHRNTKEGEEGKRTEAEGKPDAEAGAGISASEIREAEIEAAEWKKPAGEIGIRQREEKRKRILKNIALALIGGCVVVLGSNVAVDAAGGIARMIGLSEKFIGLTVVALGTSLPELATSVTAARKGNADIAIGNIVGSNIFNILFVLGISSVIIPIEYERSFLIDGGVAVLAFLILWGFSLACKKLGKISGITMLAAYGGYFAYLVTR